MNQLIGVLASSGGFVAVFMVLSIGPSIAAGRIRVGINAGLAFACILLCSALFELVMDRKCSHRWLHALMLLAFIAVSGAHIWLAWEWLIHAPNVHLPIWALVAQDTLIIIFAIYFYSTRHDLQLTYQRSEEQRRANLHRIENVHQGAMLLDFKVDQGAKS